MDALNEMTVTFRAPPELEPILPRPITAVQGIPDWFKQMPQRAFSEINQKDLLTMKKCPPVIDAMAYGFLLPLVSDLKVENGEFTWDRDVPGGGVTNFTHSPIDYHDNVQVTGTPFFDDDRFIIKFNNFWTIETPPGYSLLVMHPVNRADLPFTTITGLVDTDTYTNNLMSFPARWHDTEFSGVLPKGTPIAHCMPVKREKWTARFEVLSREAAERLSETANTIANEFGIYRREFRAPKRERRYEPLRNFSARLGRSQKRPCPDDNSARITLP